MSATGLVLAIAEIAVKPPATAASEPVLTVSESSRPGSRRWVCRSTNPGIRSLPAASIPPLADLPFDFFKDLINPFSISISTIESSISFALLILITSQLLTGLHLKVDTKLPFVLPRHFLLDQ